MEEVGLRPYSVGWDPSEMKLTGKKDSFETLLDMLEYTFYARKVKQNLPLRSAEEIFVHLSVRFKYILFFFTLPGILL